MQLDVLTLIVAGSFVGLISAVVLTGAWLNMARPRALKWWAASMYVYAAAVGAIAVAVAIHWSPLIAEANFLFLASSALMWAGVRAFDRRAIPVVALTAALFTWSIAVSLLILTGHSFLALFLGFTTSIILTGATQIELWRGPPEERAARWTLIGLLLVHGVILLGGLVDLFHPSTSRSRVPPSRVGLASSILRA